MIQPLTAIDCEVPKSTQGFPNSCRFRDRGSPNLYITMDIYMREKYLCKNLGVKEGRAFAQRGRILGELMVYRTLCKY